MPKYDEINVKKMSDELVILKGQIKLLTRRLELYRQELREIKDGKK